MTFSPSTNFVFDLSTKVSTVPFTEPVAHEKDDFLSTCVLGKIGGEAAISALKSITSTSKTKGAYHGSSVGEAVAKALDDERRAFAGVSGAGLWTV